MINDIPDCIGGSNFIFMDDTTVSECVHSSTPTNSQIQTTLSHIDEWASINNMKLNPKKCKEMRLFFGKQPPNFPPLSLDNSILEIVENFKALGLIINNKLKWDSHVDEMVKKASQRLHILRVLCRFGAAAHELKQIYISLVRSTLEYACIVWQGGLTEKNRSAIERIQKRALRIIYPYLSYSESLSLLQLDTLESRRQKISRKFAGDIVKSDHKLHYHIPPTSRHGYPTRNKNLVNFKIRTKRKESSPVVYSIRLLQRFTRPVS